VTKRAGRLSLWGLVRPGDGGDEGDGARAAEELQALPQAEDRLDQQPGAWGFSSSTQGAQLARALEEPRRRRLRRPADRRLLSAAPGLTAPYSEEAMPELPEVEITARLLTAPCRERRSSLRSPPASTP